MADRTHRIGGGRRPIGCDLPPVASGLSSPFWTRGAGGRPLPPAMPGHVAFTDILPLASPGILKKAPKWLLDPLGRCTVPPAYALEDRAMISASGVLVSRPAWRIQTAARPRLMDLSKRNSSRSSEQPARRPCCARKATSSL